MKKNKRMIDKMMNFQPPPPGPPNGDAYAHLFSMGTIHLMITITLFLQGLLILLSSRIVKAYKGVFEAAFASLALAANYLILTSSQRNLPQLQVLSLFATITLASS